MPTCSFDRPAVVQSKNWRIREVVRRRSFGIGIQPQSVLAASGLNHVWVLDCVHPWSLLLASRSYVLCLV